MRKPNLPIYLRLRMPTYLCPKKEKGKLSISEWESRFTYISISDSRYQSIFLRRRMPIYLSQFENANLSSIFYLRRRMPIYLSIGVRLRLSINLSDTQKPIYLSQKEKDNLSIPEYQSIFYLPSQKENADALTLRSVASTFPLVRLKLEIQPACPRNM